MLPDAQPDRRSNASGHLDIGVLTAGERSTVRLEGELDLVAAPEVTSALEAVAAKSTAVLLDIDAVTFMDSAGLRCVLMCERICREAGVSFALTPGSPRIRRLFGIAGLLDWLPAAASDPAPVRPRRVEGLGGSRLARGRPAGMSAHARLRTRVAVVVGLGALLVAVGVALLLGNTLKLRRETDAATRSDNYVVRVIELERGGRRRDGPARLRDHGEAAVPAAAAPSPGRTAGRRAGVAACGCGQPRRRAASETLIASVRSYLAGYVLPLLATAQHDPASARSLARR